MAGDGRVWRRCYYLCQDYHSPTTWGDRVATVYKFVTSVFPPVAQAEIAELSRREDEGVENSLAAVRQWEHDTAAQLLLPLPADVKGGPLALLAGHGGIGSGGGGLGTPGSTGGYGGGLGTPGAGGGMVGSSGGSSTSGVRGAGSFSFGSFRK